MKHRKARSARRPDVRRGRLANKVVLAIGAGVLVLAGIYWTNEQDGSAPSVSQGQSAGFHGSGQYVFQIGEPGPGEAAPPIRLAATTGGTFDLASLRGRAVLLYFQEGVMCQPCWDQLTDIETNIRQFQGLGIDSIVSITSDPLDVLKQKVADQRLSTPVLSDPDLAVSKTYDANSYGMMGKSRNGHTFILVGPDGRILWRADYGGEPNYVMYVPVATLMADMRNGPQKIAANR